ncbi:mast cell protease 1A-like [Mauremys reevesii]|uniref:mast cell protease 1A-like n=1 Tax=Mauremys reevesii TaxID=260615 RepID=UPI00193F1A98|nr:mast cell protease 1A-like [Mauremys reevesii]
MRGGICTISALAVRMLLFLLPAAFLVQILPPGAQGGGIVGGQEAVPHSRPYMAFLKMKRCFGLVNTCGGFLIREDVVVTAAHCRVNKGIVILGAHNISKTEQRRQKIRVKRWIPHPEYDKMTDNNDIMLLQLRNKAELNDWVQPISLPHPWPEVPVGTKCNVSGWGRTQVNSSKKSDVLRDVVLEVMADKVCKRKLTRRYDAVSMLCAGDPKHKKSTLKGDSGGPLVCDGVPQGIVSWGPSNGASPEVYARVSRFVHWIQMVMKELKPLDAPGVLSQA